VKKNEVKTVAEHSNALFGSGITLRISRHGRLGTLANSCLSPDLTTFAVTWGPVPTWTICGLIRRVRLQIRDLAEIESNATHPEPNPFPQVEKRE